MKDPPYCPPIPYDGQQPCTVEFAETAGGGVLFSWRISSEADHRKGKTRIGICEWGAKSIFYYDYLATRDSLEDDFQTADREDCAAIAAAWPTFEAMREELLDRAHFEEIYRDYKKWEDAFPTAAEEDDPGL